MAYYDWVAERHRCSITEIFRTLKLEVAKDIESRNAIMPAGGNHVFTLSPHEDRFTVGLQGEGLSLRSVTFRLKESEIGVYDGSDVLMFNVEVTLGDDGKCRVKMNEQRRELWQMRRDALEDLFFRFVKATESA